MLAYNLDYDNNQAIVNASSSDVLRKLFLIPSTEYLKLNKINLDTYLKKLIPLRLEHKRNILNFNFNFMTKDTLLCLGGHLYLVKAKNKYYFFLKDSMGISKIKMKLIHTCKEINVKNILAIKDFYKNNELGKIQKTKSFYKDLKKCYKNLLKQI